MNVSFCDVSIDSVENKDRIEKGIQDICRRSDFISGKHVTLFETAFASYIGTNYCVGVANGTDALEIAIESLQLEPNSKVLVQGNSYIATALAVMNQRTKYHLVLVDANNETNMIDFEDLKQKSTDAKLLIITHLFGFMPNMASLVNHCNENNINLIEDCAQAHGATWNKQKAGTFGTLSCFSFYPTKNLGAFGDGGAILTSDSTLHDWIRRRANMGSLTKNQFDILGRNSRLDTIQALVLHEKLPYLDNNNEKRRTIATIYTKLLQDIPEIKPIQYDKLCQPVYHLYVIRATNRNQLQEYLKQHGITTMIHYPTCIGKTDAFINTLESNATTPACEELSNEIVSLPMYPSLLQDISKIKYVVNTIKQFYAYQSSVYTTQLCSKEVESKPGRLHAMNEINQPIKRMFYIDGFENVNIPAERGNHCNVNTNEYLTVINGIVLVEIEYKDNPVIGKKSKKKKIVNPKKVKKKKVKSLCLAQIQDTKPKYKLRITDRG
jgi:dTDP-4-amino-4,6-dideoxygalactose transaminase